MKVILTEKPSVARDIARVIGSNIKKDGYIEGQGYQITWAFGHLVTIVEPEVMCKDWGGRWSFSQLPMIPETFKLTSHKNSSKQFNVISRLINSSSCTEIINATDAGREGELIFRWIYKHSQCTKPFKRLWISDLTDESIRKGLSSLYPGSDFNYLSKSAQCRAFADWMVGLNATRAYSIRNNQLCTVGRVQTPTLALIVNRNMLINGFKKCYYYELYAHVKNVPFKWDGKDGSKIEKKEIAQQLKDKLSGKPGEISNVKKTKKKTSPPPLYDLTLLQKECNEKFGYTAKQTLDIAQSLYEKHKLITYPRTESRHLSEKMRPELPNILKNAPDELKYYANISLKRIEEGHLLGKNYIDDQKLTDHHAIIPTSKKKQSALDINCNNVYMLIQKRFISVFHKDFIENVTEITMLIDKERFKFKGAVPSQIGWRQVYQNFTSNNQNNDKGSIQQIDEKAALNKYPIKQDTQNMINANFQKGQTHTIDLLEVQEKETSPPKPYTDGTLLNAMRFIGRQVDDELLAAQLKDQGLGTQATRASIIERLLKSKYIFRKGKSIFPTEKGIQLINTVIAYLKSPELTAKWEQKLSEIQEGVLEDTKFMEEIQMFTRNIIPVIKGSQSFQNSLGNKESFGTCPQCKKGQVYEGKKTSFYCSRYREGCKFVLWGTIASKKLTHTQIRKIIKDGKSSMIKGFKSKKGNKFQAIIELDSEFKTKFRFE